ncbi:hypothetical protein GCK32_022626 [Trichostrongylus colubriformis]|uniref:Uncharacterized protein n=1 Tax=Trichostrongylus colubriformis TaxID=6319 RepID=A0AAN8G121_TRICO
MNFDATVSYVFSNDSVFIQLDGAEMRGRHCVITYMDGIVTITPSASDAIIEVSA